MNYTLIGILINFLARTVFYAVNVAIMCALDGPDNIPGYVFVLLGAISCLLNVWPQSEVTNG